MLSAIDSSVDEVMCYQHSAVDSIIDEVVMLSAVDSVDEVL